jgi:hypothetical protein
VKSRLADTTGWGAIIIYVAIRRTHSTTVSAIPKIFRSFPTNSYFASSWLDSSLLLSIP